MCLSENSLRAPVEGGGDVGGSGIGGSSRALAAARKDSSSDAVTRVEDVQTRRRRMSGCISRGREA